MVASLKRVYENLWRLQKTPLTATKAQNRAHATPLQRLTHNSHYLRFDTQERVIDNFCVSQFSNISIILLDILIFLLVAICVRSL